LLPYTKTEAQKQETKFSKKKEKLGMKGLAKSVNNASMNLLPNFGVIQIQFHIVVAK